MRLVPDALRPHSGTHPRATALKQDGTVWAWGANSSGQLGDGTTTSRSSPVQVLGPGGTGVLNGVIAIAAGAAHSVALKSDGSVWVWGTNAEGQVGNGTTSSTGCLCLSTPTQASISGVSAIATRGWHTLALKSDGTVWGWGYNADGALGDGTLTGPRTSPVQVVGVGGTGTLRPRQTITSWSADGVVVEVVRGRRV